KVMVAARRIVLDEAGEALGRIDDVPLGISEPGAGFVALPRRIGDDRLVTRRFEPLDRRPARRLDGDDRHQRQGEHEPARAEQYLPTALQCIPPVSPASNVPWVIA